MTSANLRRALAAGLLLLLAVNAAAQVTTSKPIRIEVPPPKKLKFKGEVLWMNRRAISVRSRENHNVVRIFTYDKKLAAKMAKLIDRQRPFQHGDRIEIHYRAGTDTAFKIKGKPRQRR